MESAAAVAVRRGIEGASLDEVAQSAGFTKGAVYANFRNKEELFLAMLDAHFDARLERDRPHPLDRGRPRRRRRARPPRA